MGADLKGELSDGRREFYRGFQIAVEALKIIKSPDLQGQPIYLSLLGARLSKVFTNWRSVLDGRNLHKLLERELRNEVAFDGDIKRRIVRVSRDSDNLDVMRFDKVILAAFYKPIISWISKIAARR